MRGPLIVVGAVVLVGMMLVGSGAAPGALVPAEESRTVNNIVGSVKLLGGRSNAGSEFVASWDYGGHSETVTMAGVVRYKVPQCDITPKFRYAVYVDGALAAVSPEYPTPAAVSGFDYALPSWTWQFKGPSGGDKVLKATLEAHTLSRCVTFNTERSWQEIAVDGARLLDGAGMVSFAGGTDRYAHGEIITLNIHTGAGGPWRLDVVNGLGGVGACGFAGSSYGFQRVPSAMTADQMVERACRGTLTWPGKFDGTVQFRVPPDAFRADGKNTWKFTLTNEVFKRAEERAFVIDTGDRAPEPPLVTVSPNPVKPGEPVKIDMQARANPHTRSPIKEFHVTVWYGTSDRVPTTPSDFVVNELVVPASAASGTAYTGTATVTPTKAVDLRYRVVAIDEAGRPSGTVINGAQAKQLADGGLEKPNTNSRGSVDVEGATTEHGFGTPGAGPDWGIVLLGVALSLIAAGFAYYYLPVPPTLRVASASLVLFLGAFLAWGASA